MRGEGGRGKRQAAWEEAESVQGGLALPPWPGLTRAPRCPRPAAPTVPAVEAAAAVAALSSPHTDNMAAAEEETHGSAASRRDQSEATASNAGSGSPLPTRDGAEPERAEPPSPRRLRLSAAMLVVLCHLGAFGDGLGR